MSHLILVRHSLPEILPDVDARNWPLSAEGRSRCHALAAQLAPYPPTRFISSDEPKAIETAEIVAAQFNQANTVAAGLHEHDRRNTPYLTNKPAFEAAIAEFFEKPDQLVYGNETADQALSRFTAAIEKACKASEGNIVVVSHGTVITLFVAAHNAIQPFAFWKNFAMPAIVVLNLPGFGFQALVG
jgi:broad specificity phosphatase PhoE